MKTIIITFFLLTTLVSNLIHGSEKLYEFKINPLLNSEEITESSHPDKIIVLDFYAHWCHPCQKVTPLIEKEIQKHYNELSGNKFGRQVQIVPVNVDPSSKTKTLKFLKKYQVHQSWQDNNGTLFEKIGKNHGLPFIAVIATNKGKQQPYTIHYAQAGEPDWNQLRNIIDTIQ